MSRAHEGQEVTARYDRDKAQREASRDRESLDLTDWWAYLVSGGSGCSLARSFSTWSWESTCTSCFLAASSQPSLSAFSGFYSAYESRSKYWRYRPRRLLPR